LTLLLYVMHSNKHQRAYVLPFKQFDIDAWIAR